MSVNFQKNGLIRAVGTGVGENLILESHAIVSCSAASGITKEILSDGSLKIIAESGNSNWCSFQCGKHADTNQYVGNHMTVGDNYTISCDCKIESGSSLPTLFINAGNGYKALHPVKGTITTGSWMRVYYSSTWAEPGTSYGNIQLHLGFSGCVGTYYFRNFKLEKGSVPTLWCSNETDSIYTGSTVGFFEGESASVYKDNVQATNFIEW